MRKLTKKALSLVLCVMLVISAFSCAISAFAETPGTTEVNGMTVYDAPFDLDFSDGLQTWVGITSTAGNPMYVAEDGVLRADLGIKDQSGWQPVGPAPFKIPGAVAGTGIEFSFDLSVVTEGLEEDHLTALNQLYNVQKVSFIQYNADGTVKASQIDLAYTKNHVGTKKSQAFRIDDPDEFFQIIFKSPGKPGFAWRISNITITETTPPPAIEPDEEYEFTFDTLDAPEFYGTPEQGFSSALTTSYPVRLKPAEAIANLDFEAGFVYWSGQKVSVVATDTLVYPSDNFKLVPDGDNIYLTVKNAGYSKTIQTTFFDVSSKLAIGDTVVLIYDAKGEDATKIMPLLKQDAIRPVEYGEDGLSTTLNPNGNGSVWNPSNGAVSTDIIPNTASQSEFAVQTEADGWTTYVTAPATIFDPKSVNDTASDGIYLQVKVGAANGIAAGTLLDAAIDNIRIAKIVDGVYTDIATGEEIYDANGAPEGPPAYYGSEKNGFSSVVSSWPMALKPVDGVENLNFEQGFIYWSGQKVNSVASDTKVYASDTFKIVTEGDNKYVTLKDEGYVNTMRTALFKLAGVNVGDTLALVYDVKGEDADKIRVTLVQDHLRGEDQGVVYDETTGLNKGSNASPGMTNVLVNGTASLIVTDLVAADGWTTYATSFSGTVNDPTVVSTTRPCTADIYVQIIVERASGVEVGDQLDFALDNIRIAKVVDKVYYDVTTGEEIIDVSKLAPSYYGTEKDGFDSIGSSYPLALKPVDEIKNLDFSEGFIYWSGKKYNSASDPGSKASDSFALVTEGDNKYIKVKETGYVNTMRSALFKAEGVSVDDKLVLIYDVKGADANKIRVTLEQQHLRGEDQGVVYDETTGRYDGSAGSATPGTPTHLVNNVAGRIALDELPAPAGWTTYVTDYSDTVSDPTTFGGERPCSADIYLQVIVDKAPSVVAGDELDVAIDNIRIAKIVDGVYYDVATGAPIAPEVVHEYPEENAETLADMVAAILAGDPGLEYDFNYDGKVDLLDVVALKKYLAEVL